MKFSRSIVLAVALIFAWATAGFAAHSAEICQKRIESFNYLVDYSGSMMMNFPSVGKTKMAVAKEVGLDMAKLEKDLASAEVRNTLEENFKLAEAMGMNGTPSYVIGKQIVIGAVGAETLREKINNARCGKATC